MRFRWARTEPRSRAAAAIALAAACAALLFLVWVSRIRYRFPFEDLEARRPARVYTDCRGSPIGARLGDGDQWRLPVGLSDVSPPAVQATLAVEDHRFWSHHGVDWRAVVRAAASNLAHGRIVSGASTISMQLARLARPEPRGWGMKWRQMWRAVDVERSRGKRWILEQYLNHAPYGSNVVGVEAAARRYFGKAARELDTAEAALLAGLPQRPAALRPDRYPERARKRQQRVIRRMAQCGYIADLDGRRLLAQPIRLNLASGRVGLTPVNRLGILLAEPQVCQLAELRAPANQSRVRTTIDPVIQALCRTALAAQVRRLPDVDDGAAVVIESETGAVRAMVGTIDYGCPRDGQTNAATAGRSPGSALKPFIYLVAIDGGLIVPGTTVDDRPLGYRDYRPANFDGTHAGLLTAREALATSRNTPAVRLLAQIGVPHFLAQLRLCGIRSLDRDEAKYGLSLALGGGEVTLLELTNAYAGLARGGAFRPWRVLEDASPAADCSRPFAEGSVALLAGMMSGYPLPGNASLRVAWKTGTSNGFRDAWCLAFGESHTVGVWIGNKCGRAAASLVGSEVAAPVVSAVLTGLSRGGGLAPVRAARGTIREIVVCRDFGLRATIRCPSRTRAMAPLGIPLQPCRAHRSVRGGVSLASAQARANGREGVTTPSRERPGVVIESPRAGVYVMTHGPLRLRLASRGGRVCYWFLDGRPLGPPAGEIWRPVGRGRHAVVCVSPLSAESDRVELVVR